MNWIEDGFSTTLTLAEGSITFEEVRITPPGIDGGGAINTTTMRNTRRRTKKPKQLVDTTDTQCSGKYAPELYDEIMDQIQVNQEITVTYPDLSTYVFWGWIDNFQPGEHVEGEMPLADFTIIASNVDDAGDEHEPVMTATGTTTTTT